jgi:L-alanine-DL-glutamate epimerase-like enolase superfamily enzyme
MRISSFRIRVCQPKTWQFQWRDDIAPIKMTMTVLEIATDDGYRTVADVVGGITGMRKVTAAAEVRNRRLEPHSYGSTLVQAAHLHHILASRNCEYFEVPHPKETLDFGMKDVIEIDTHGHVHAPTKPGLGFDLDWDVIDNSTVTEFK